VANFNGKLCGERQNEQSLKSLTEACELIGAWRADYNYPRPHSALGYSSPIEFCASWRARHPGYDGQGAHP
jgi:putative transposase